MLMPLVWTRLLHGATITICNLSHRVTCCAMVKIVAQSRIGFYFLKRLHQFFPALHRVTPFQQLVSQCFHNNDCERMPLPSLLAFIEKVHKLVAACNTPHLATATPHKSSLRDKLHEKLHRVTGPLPPPGDYVFTSVCLFVARISQNVLHPSSWQFVERLAIDQGPIH